MNKPPSSFDAEGFVLGNQLAVMRKLQRFAAAGRSRVHFLFDFDRTLTTSLHTGEDITTWQLLHGLLPEHGQQRSHEIRGKYLAMESSGLLSAEDSHTFSASILDLHTHHGTSMRAVQQAAKTVHLRDGARELFAACEQAGIPTVILSAGIRDIIELIAEHNGIHPSVILSIKLEVAADGRIIGWERGSMVHMLNKRERGNIELARIRTERPFTVLIGDSLDDARMMEGQAQVLRIRVCDRRLGTGAEHEAFLAASFKAGYDMIVAEHFMPVVRLAQWLAATGEAAE